MSVVALSDIIFGDLLAERGMKPWWEKFRGYILASSVAIALSTTYFTLNGIPVYCLPVGNGNISDTCNVTTVQAAWTNAYCSNRIPWYIRYFGGMSLLAATALLFTSSYWLHIPKVIDLFVSFAEMMKIISDCNMAFADLQQMSFRPRKRDDKVEAQLQLREVCEEILQRGKTNNKLIDIYEQRNYLLVCVSVLIAIFFIIVAAWMILLGDQFRCDITTTNNLYTRGQQCFPAAVVCVSTMAYHLIVLNVLFIVSVFVQILLTYYGKLIVSKQPKVLTGFDNIEFMSVFWKHGHPTRSAMFSRLIEYVCGMEAVKDIEKSLEDAILFEDDYMLHSYAILLTTHSRESDRAKKEKPGRIIMDKMYHLYKSSVENQTKVDIKERIKAAEITTNVIVSTIEKHVPAVVLEDKCQMFLEKAVTNTNWKLTAGIMNQYVGKLGTTGDSTVKGFDLLQKLDIDYDILDEQKYSIMYYFLAEPNMRTLSKLLSKRYKGKRKSELYTHYDGRSALVNSGSDNNIEHFNTLAEIEYADSQKKIEHIYNEYLEILGSSLNLHIIRRLSRIKFREWDKTAKDFARKAHEKKDWQTFVTLLDCFIISEKNEVSCFPLSCGVPDIYERDTLCSVLRLTQPSVSTAAKHIISLCKPHEIEAARESIKAMSRPVEDLLLEFIIKFQLISEQRRNSTQPAGTARVALTGSTTNGANNGISSNLSSDSAIVNMECASTTD